MNELFGIPMDTLLAVLAVLLAVTAGMLGLLALRNRVLLKLGVRNLGRRRARSALIVVGLMLGTAIIAAALATGDTMNHTIRSTAISALGETDEVVSARGAVEDIPGELGQASGTGYFSERTVDQVSTILHRSNLADGVAGGIRKNVAVQAPVQRQTEPSVSLFAPDPSRMEGFAPIEDVEGGEVTLADLPPGELYLNEKAADKLHVSEGDPLLVYIEGKPVRMKIQTIVRFDGAGTADSALLLPLGEAQRLYDKPGLIEGILISNRGTGDAAVGLTDEVVDALKPTVAPLGLETAPAKKDALDLAEQAGTAFMTLFTTFGTFSPPSGGASSGSHGPSEHVAATSSRCSRSRAPRTTSSRQRWERSSARWSRTGWWS
jgi:putative ABC transport system permease protein